MMITTSGRRLKLTVPDLATLPVVTDEDPRMRNVDSDPALHVDVVDEHGDTLTLDKSSWLTEAESREAFKELARIGLIPDELADALCAALLEGS
jgi:hypothetical protein